MKLTQAAAKTTAVSAIATMTTVRWFNGSLGRYGYWGDCPR